MTCLHNLNGVKRNRYRYYERHALILSRCIRTHSQNRGHLERSRKY